MKQREEKLTFSIKTLGCKVNRYESELLAENLKKAGLKPGAFPSTHIIVLNACSVTTRSEAKLRNELHKANRQENAHIILCGCLSETLKSYISQFSHIHICPPQNKNKIRDVIKAISTLIRTHEKTDPFQGFSDQKILTSFSLRTRAFIKIQDGCQSFCSYCIIPLMRQTLWSRDTEEIIQEIRQIEKTGRKEIVLTGIHVGQYNWKGSSLSDLVKIILDQTDISRIRLSSIEPLEIDKKLISLFRKNERLCPHFHIPLQSASGRILKSMNRKYTFSQFQKITAKIREHVPNVSFTTDLITGFPGENDKDFESSLDAIRETGFLKVHVFPFSAREGTKAYESEDKVPEKIIRERRKIMQAVSDETAKQFKEKWIGKTVQVLFEQSDKKNAKTYTGFSRNYLKVSGEAKTELKNTIRNIQIGSLLENGTLKGTVL